MESLATAAKEASTTAIQFEAPIISIPHLVQRARLLNNAAFDDSRFQRGIVPKGRYCALCPDVIDSHNCDTVLSALGCGWGLFFVVTLTLYIIRGNGGSSNVVL